MDGLQVTKEVLGTASLLLVGVQGLKKMPWVSAILERLLGQWVGPVLALAGGVLSGFVLFAGDGSISLAEAGKIVGIIGSAMAGHVGLKALAAPER